jgi:hypothetical protein
MAGSKRWFAYTSDLGVSYSVQLDESNSKALCGGMPLFVARSSAFGVSPRTLSWRFVNCTLVSNRNIRRRFYVGNPAAIPAVLSGSRFLAVVYPIADDSEGVAEIWIVGNYRGEVSSPSPSLLWDYGDSGLIDGTPDGLPTA